MSDTDISLNWCGQFGNDSTPIQVDASQIASITPDPISSSEFKTLVTLDNGEWYLVHETIEQVEQLKANALGAN